MSGRIFITGDKHGTFLPLFGLAEKMELQKTDVLIIAGDAGYIWNEDYPYAAETLEQIFPGLIAFVDGNHENHALLNDMEVREWRGGRVHMVGKRVYHLMRGEVYSIYGKRIFVCGGARSNDKDRRKEGISWWTAEEPSPAEIAYAEGQLAKYAGKIDFVITHEPPLFARESVRRRKPLDADYLLPAIFQRWYEEMEASIERWYFGHMHVDEKITPKLRAVYQDILLLGEDIPQRWG